MPTPTPLTDATAAGGPEWLVARRRAAAEAFAAAELPSPDEEVWRYSRIADLDLGAFAPADGAAPAAPAERAAATLALAEGASVVAWTEDGRIGDVRIAEGCRVEVTHGDALAEDGPLGEVLPATDTLTSLHDAHATPLVVRVPEGVDGGTVVVVHHAGTAGVASFPRVVVEAGQASQVAVVELHVGPDGVRNLSVPVTELLVRRDATLRHATVQLLGDQTWQLGRLASTVDAGGQVLAGVAAFGGDYARLRVDTTLAGRGAHGGISAAYFGDGTQLLDFRTFQDHVAPDTTSNLLFKGALGQKGASVYTGLIKIRPDARGTNAFQTNANLKLSDDAWAESVPNLEIENNEVQCSHASTVGPVDPEQRWYLESRGVPTDRAERLIVRGFFDEVLDGMPLGAFETLVRDAIDTDLERSMS